MLIASATMFVMASCGSGASHEGEEAAVDTAQVEAEPAHEEAPADTAAVVADSAAHTEEHAH